MMKAAAPMMGGSSCPPTEADDSTAPANSLLYPVFFINGMVKAPVVTTFATALPLIEMRKPLAMTATLAGPPFELPANASARSLKNLPIPHLFITVPNMMNRKI
ncbi:hypothetical protein DSECCO2_645910 [anaerobic digester metagenome]